MRCSFISTQIFIAEGDYIVIDVLAVDARPYAKHILYLGFAYVLTIVLNALQNKIRQIQNVY